MALNGLPAVNCARPSRWGNPWKIGQYSQTEIPPDGIGPLIELFPARLIDRAFAIQQFRRWIQSCHGEIETALRGKNLACTCDLSDACHADVLLEIANA